MAEERGAHTISFPSISTGAYGYPLEEAAAIALKTVAHYLDRPEARVREVIFVLFDHRAYDAHARLLEGPSGGSVQ
jgi:O-acetyl-ADP-ribose deacetylase (regulator of RNase III)